MRLAVAGFSVTMTIMLLSLSGCAPQSNAAKTENDTANMNKPSSPESGSDASSDAHSKPQETPQSHVGSWKATSAVMAGKPFPEAVVNGITLTLTDSGYVADFGGDKDKGSCEVDRTTTPNRMKITSTEGPNAGKLILAIVDYPEPGKMRVAYDLAGKSYPVSFESTEETGYYVAAYSKVP